MTCKKILSTMLMIVLVVLCLPATVLATEQESFTLCVGYWSGYGISKDENGALYGYAYDYMTKIAELNHWQVDFVPCTWDEGLNKLANGEIDVFGPLQKTPEREKLFDYPTLRMGDEYGALYVRDDNNTIFYENPASLDGKILAITTSNYYLNAIDAYCAQHHITLQKKLLNDATNFDQSFANGTVDLQASGSMLMPQNAKVVLRFNNEDFFYPTTKGNKMVLDGLNHALQIIQKENPYYDAELYDKYYEQTNSSENAFTAAEYTTIITAPLLKIGYLKDQAPLIYENKGAVQGIVPDLLTEVSAYSGLKFQWLPVHDTTEAIQKLQSGELDFVSGIIGSPSFAQENGLIQSASLLQNKLIFIIKQGSHFDDQNFVLAIPRDWLGIQHQMAHSYPNVQIKTYATIGDCLDAVLHGNATATVQNALATDRTMKSHQYQPLSINSMSKGDVTVCLSASTKIPPALLAALNKSINAIDRDTRNQSIYQHTVAVPYRPSFWERLRINTPFLIFGILLIALLIHLISRRSRRELNKLAYYDPLTGEMNLTKFKLEAQKLMNRSDQTYALMVLDIDKFKSINDLYGYEFGDRMIILVAKALRECLLPDTILCHGAADKFDFFFAYHGQAWFSEQFERLVNNVETTLKREMPTCNIVLSVGVCILQPGDNNIISIIDRANIASKQIKSYHASSFAFYDPAMYARINRAKTIENEMSEALANQEFAVYLQPKIALPGGHLAGAEALVRWIHPQQGLMPPNDFIPLFEENGFIVSLDYYMLEHVCQLLEHWKQEGRTLFTISVNLSRLHLQNPNTAKLLADIVARYDVDPSLIELELTESAFDNCNLMSITTLFNDLHHSGFTVSVDDFGSGYSSLSLLKDLPIDVLKIDKSFFTCQQDGNDDKMGVLLESVISLSRKLNIKTLSEGVETSDQVNLLVQLGCDLVQGFYFARPMPVAQLEKLLDSDDLFKEIIKVGEVTDDVQ